MEAPIDGRLDLDLSRAGFISLGTDGSGACAFWSTSAARLPEANLTEKSPIMQRLSVQLPYILVGCRFANFVRAVVRDSGSACKTKQEFEALANRWAIMYVQLDDAAPEHVRAKYPLREFRLDVCEDGDHPQKLIAEMRIMPNFLLERPPQSLRFRFELPEPAAYVEAPTGGTGFDAVVVATDRESRAIADSVADVLRVDGYSVHVLDLTPGSDYLLAAQQREQSRASAHCMILVAANPESLRRPAVDWEWRRFLEEREGADAPLVIFKDSRPAGGLPPGLQGQKVIGYDGCNAGMVIKSVFGLIEQVRPLIPD